MTPLLIFWHRYRLLPPELSVEQRLRNAGQSAAGPEGAGEGLALSVPMSNYRFPSKERPRRFDPRRALAGKHRPARVALHGGGYLAAYSAFMFILYGTGVLPIDPIASRRALGVAAGPVGHVVQIVLWMGYASLCVWLTVALWRCGRNTETRRGFFLARGVAIACPVVCAALAAMCVGAIGF